MIDWETICKGCGACCGPVPFGRDFLMENAHLYQEQPVMLQHWPRCETAPITESLECVFLDKGTKRCLVYDNRPEVCRLQGTIPELPCPRLALTEAQNL